MADHARLSMSNKRWPHCPGSVREEAPYPDTSSRAAIDGTGSHLLLELCVKHGHSPEQYLSDTIGVGHEDMPLGWVVHQDRVDRVNMALAYIERRKRELQERFPTAVIEVQSESKSNAGSKFQPSRDDWWGTCDITIAAKDPNSVAIWFLEVVDYKDGRQFVPAEDNSQLIGYAAGKIPHSASGGATIEGVRMAIVQPKSNKPVRYTDEGWFKVHDEAFKLFKRAQDTDDPAAPLIAGWWCQWCKANPKNGGHCTQAAQQANQEIQAMTESNTGFEKLLELDVREATEQELVEVADLEPHVLKIQEALDRVKAEIQSRVEQDIPVQGWALKPGRKSRGWSDEAEVEAILNKTKLKKDEFAPRKLLTPAQAEKTVSSRTWERLQELVEETPGKLKLARVSPEDTAPEKTPEDLFGAAQQSAPSFL